MFDTLRYTPRYIRNSDAFGWQGADNPNGPWRSISPPESGTPFQITNPMGDLRQASADVSGVKVLSPAAQAVMIAATNGNTNVIDDPVYRQCIAAAVRAAVGQVRTDPNLKRHIAATLAEMLTLDKILTIAAELERGND